MTSQAFDFDDVTILDPPDDARPTPTEFVYPDPQVAFVACYQSSTDLQYSEVSLFVVAHFFTISVDFTIKRL